MWYFSFIIIENITKIVIKAVDWTVYKIYNIISYLGITDYNST